MVLQLQRVEKTVVPEAYECKYAFSLVKNYVISSARLINAPEMLLVRFGASMLTT